MIAAGYIVAAIKPDGQRVVFGHYATRAGALATVRGLHSHGMHAEALPAAGLPTRPGTTIAIVELTREAQP